MSAMKRAMMVLTLTMLELMTGCAVSGYGTADELVFDAQQGDPAPPNKASWSTDDSEVLSLEFNCPGQVHSLMMSIIIPLPPVIPVRSVDDNYFFAIVSLPKNWPKFEPPLHITLANGQMIPWPSEDEQAQISDGGKNLKHFYKFKLHCKVLEGATVQYSAQPTATTPAHAQVVRRLTFTSKKYTDFGYLRS